MKGILTLATLFAVVGSLLGQTLKQIETDDSVRYGVYESTKLPVGEIGEDRRLIFCDELLGRLDSARESGAYTMWETFADIYLDESSDSIPITVYDFINNGSGEPISRLEQSESVDVQAMGLYMQASICRVFTHERGFSAICFKGLSVDEERITEEVSRKMIGYFRKTLCQRICDSEATSRNFRQWTCQHYQYYEIIELE